MLSSLLCLTGPLGQVISPIVFGHRLLLIFYYAGISEKKGQWLRRIGVLRLRKRGLYDSLCQRDAEACRVTRIPQLEES